MPDDVTVLPPDHLGRYLITGVVGEGAMGVVYRGFDPVIGRAVAIKTLPRRHTLATPEGVPASALRARFRHEAQAGGRLAHPGIVGVHEYAEEEGIAYIVMEYVEGHNLSQWLARTPRLPDRLVVQLVDQVLDALEAAHAAGVWHRDIKPSNLLVTPAGRVKLTDFGIARFADHDGEDDGTTITGSPGYIAPELYTGHPADHRVDLFSVGVLLYRLLVGRAPFAGTPEQAMYRTLHEEPAPVSVAAAAHDAPGRDQQPRDARFDALVQRAIAKSPDARFPSAAAFRHALREAAGVLAVPVGAARAATPAGPQAASAFPAHDDAPTHGLPPAHAPADWPRTFGPWTGPNPGPRPPSMPIPPFRPGERSPEERAWRDGVEAALMDVLGPVAHLLMRRARKLTSDPAGLVARLAASIGDDVDRARFLREVRRLSVAPLVLAQAGSDLGIAGRVEGPVSDPGADSLPSALLNLGTTGSGRWSDFGTGGFVEEGPMLPSEAIGHALRVLTAHLGAEARAVIKGVAGEARSTEELHALILARLDARRDAHGRDHVDRRLLEAQLQRGLRH